MNFWIIAIALLALALVILLLPMLRRGREETEDQRQQQNIQIAREQKRQLQAQLESGDIDQAEFDAAYLDLQTALALELNPEEATVQKKRGRWMALVVLLAVPVASISLYLGLGEYRVIENPELVRAAPAEPHTAAARDMTFEEMEAAIKERLQEDNEDAEGWFMLGRIFMAQQKFDQAVTAYQRAHDLVDNEPGIMFALADALAMQNNGNLLGEPEELVLRALELAPRFPNGLWLAGSAAEQRQDYEAAHRYWTRLLPLLADDPQSASQVQNLLQRLEQQDPTLASTEVASAATGIRVTVDINDELKARASPETTVFVYAKAMQGPPMPLAVKRM